jgi:hypothetical protein
MKCLSASGAKDYKVAQAAASGRDRPKGKYTRDFEAPELGPPSKGGGPKTGPRQGAQGQIQALLRRAQGCSDPLRTAQAWRRLAQPQLKVAY